MTLSFRSFTSAHALALLALTGLIWYATTFLRSPTGVLVRVYAGANWSGVPRVATVDDRVSTAFLKRHWPPTDEVLRVRWDAFLRVNGSGVSRFSVIADAGTRLYVDNQLTIDTNGIAEHGLAPCRAVRLRHRQYGLDRKVQAGTAAPRPASRSA
jgi:hypothetical protein